MGRGLGGRHFKKTIHHYEPMVQGKWHKVPIIMLSKNVRVGDGKTENRVVFYTEHFKTRGLDAVEFDNLFELYAWIEDNLVELPPLEWTPKIYVKVSGSSTFHAEPIKSYHDADLASCTLSVQVEIREFATDPEGQLWSRSPNPKHYKDFKKFDELLGVGEAPDTRYWWNEDKDPPMRPYSNALIEDTPENRAMIAQFVVKFEELKDQFRKAMSQDYVKRFLAVNTIPMLPGVDIAEE